MQSYKFEHTCNIIVQYQLDIFCIIETWFKCNVIYSVPSGYNLCRKDREGKTHGGVAIIYKNSIKCTEVNIDLTKFKEPYSLEFI